MIMQPAMVPVILRVFGEGGAATDVPVTPETTCRDVVECTREPGDDECRLVEFWRDCERTLREDDRPLEILQEWGCHRDEVRFVLRYTVVPPSSPHLEPTARNSRDHQLHRRTHVLAPYPRRRRNGGRNSSNDGGMKEPGPLCELLPEGAGLTLSELREMAGRQQRQIDSQRQLLAAKEQRLLFLKQQDARSHAAAAEQERLRRLRARVDAQEMKLRKLRALRGQVDQQRVSNTTLTSDLDSIRALFNEKEKELCMAVAKVEELTRQLEEVKRGRANAASSATSGGHTAMPSAAALELEKLRRELMYRNKLNEQQSQKLSQQRETINARHEEMARIDARISELQERLHRKRLLNQQLASQLSAQQLQQQQTQGSVPAVNVQQHRPVSRPNIAAVEPFLRRRNPPPAPVAVDQVAPTPAAPEFAASKSDPKYQTLPYNTKFAASLAAGRAASKAANEESSAPPPSSSAPVNINNNNNNVNNNNNINVNNNAYNNLVNLVHSTPAVTAARKGLATGLPDVPSSGGNEQQQQSQQQTLQSQQPGAQRVLGSSHPSYVPPPPVPSGPRGQPVGGSIGPPVVRTTVRPPNGQDLAQSVAAMVQSVPVKPPVVTTASSKHPSSNGHQRLQASSSLPSTPISSQPRPVSSVAPSVTSTAPSQQPQPPPPPPPPMQKPSPIYQASAKKVMIPHPITLSSTCTPSSQSNGSQNLSQTLILSPPQSTSTPIGTPEVESSSARGRPALPPKPVPPPRLHAQPQSPEDESSPHSPPPPPPPATEPPVDEPSPLPTPTGATVQRKPSLADLPIKARPLTLKKPVAGEQPKLKAAASNRRIEMPPAFLFPETEPPPADLSPSSSGTPSPKEGPDEPDRAITISSPDESPKSEGSRVDVLNNINQEHLSVEQLVRRARKGGLKSKGTSQSQAAMRRVSFDPLALLLDASLEGELELVKRTAGQVANPSAANDEGITALHNAICAGHFEIVRFLVQFGCDVNAQDSDGWTPLHCAASCNNLAMVKFLVEHGACIFATTLSDRETAAEKCEEDEEGFDGCSEYLYSVQEKLGILNQGVVYAVYDYEAHNSDELSFSDGDQMVVLRKGDELEREWWWSRLNDKEGYVPRNLLGLYPRVQFKKQE